MSHTRINIEDPANYDRTWQVLLEREVIEARIRILQKRVDNAEEQLGAIFTRIAAGEPVELHYRDGSVVTLVAGKSR